MGVQRTVAAKLNAERQDRMRELLASEPLLTRSSALAIALDVMHAAWVEEGRDLKRLLRKPPGRAPTKGEMESAA